MLQLQQIGSNQTLIVSDRVEILFSYETPVAYKNTESDEVFVTDESFSSTTSRHINSWVQDAETTPVSQDQIEGLLANVEIDPAPNEPDGLDEVAPLDSDPMGGVEVPEDNVLPRAQARIHCARQLLAQSFDHGPSGEPEIGESGGPSLMDPFDEEEKISECPTCSAPNAPMGSLGTRTHYRCRNCGMDYSEEAKIAQTFGDDGPPVVPGEPGIPGADIEDPFGEGDEGTIPRQESVQVGDRVKYSDDFLRSVDITTGPVLSAEGVVTDIDSGGRAAIDWGEGGREFDYDELPPHADVSNLVRSDGSR